LNLLQASLRLRLLFENLFQEAGNTKEPNSRRREIEEMQ
jgi:hypothetical protein